MPMTRPKLNYVIDVAMFGLMGAMVFIGVLLGFFISSGPVSAGGTKYFWGLHRHQWGDIHLILSLFFVSFFLLHLLIHWKWIKGATRKLLRSPSSLFVILLLPALMILGAWSLSEKDSPEYTKHGYRAGSEIGRVEEPSPPAPASEEVASERKKSKKVEINGRMSLKDVEKATGIPAKKIADSLGLPRHASLDLNLGRLRRTYNFQIQQVRDMITKLSGGEIEATDSDEASHQAVTPGKSEGKQEQRGLRRKEINGRLTLKDVERLTGVPTRVILKKLNLPADTPLDERLGRLRKRHGFTMHDVSDAVSSLTKQR